MFLTEGESLMNESNKAKTLLRNYIIWPILVSVVLIVVTFAMWLISARSGIIMTLFTILMIFMLISLYIHFSKRVDKELIKFAMHNQNTQNILAKEFGLPYAIIDINGMIAWKNDAFSELIGDDRVSDNNISSIFPNINSDDFIKIRDSRDYHEEYGEKKYHIHIKKSSILEVDMYAVFLNDETEFIALKEEQVNRKLVAGLIYMDNYEEVMESVEEVRRSLLTALIDRKINQYISGMNGIVKKLEKDKYFFVIKYIHLEKMQSDRFSILEDAKTVNIGNDMSMTLSIGIGVGGDTYAQNYEYARMAIDMALGRGGDQAVVKENDAIRYFGGKSRTVEKSTRVKARVKAHALRELMDNKDRVIIMGHKNMDIDVFGSSIGIWRIAMALNKKAHIVTSNINSSLRPLVERFNRNEYPEDLFISADKVRELVDDNTMLVVVDVNRPSITEMPELLKTIKTIVVLDHHRQSSEIIDNAVLYYVEPYASSACEMVAEIVQYIADDIKLKQIEADAMYAGIVIDTNNFSNQAGVRTFEAAAFLRRHGADSSRVRKLFREKLVDYKAKAQAIHNAEIFESFAISECPTDNIESPTVVGAQAANELLDIIGVKASIVLTLYNNIIYVSARSIDEVNVQVMMEKLGGGGHRNIAGAQLNNMTVEEAKMEIKNLISKMIEKGEIV